MNYPHLPPQARRRTASPAPFSRPLPAISDYGTDGPDATNRTAPPIVPWLERQIGKISATVIAITGGNMDSEAARYLAWIIAGVIVLLEIIHSRRAEHRNARVMGTAVELLPMTLEQTPCAECERRRMLDALNLTPEQREQLATWLRAEKQLAESAPPFEVVTLNPGGAQS